MIDYDKYRHLLEEEKERLEKSLEKVAFRNDRNPTDWVPKRDSLNISDGEAVEPMELAGEIQEYEGNTATVKELESRWHEVTEALERIEKGTFGVDQISGEPINPERLDINPAARTSTENAELVEKEPPTENEIN